MALTAKQLTAQRRQLRREMDRDLRAKDSAKLKKLREHLRHAKALKRQRMAEIVQGCRAVRKANVERTKRERAAARVAVNEKAEKRRKAARASCELAKKKTRKKSDDAIERAMQNLAAERKYQATIRRYAQPAKLNGSRRGARGGAKAAERRAESDSRVAQNISQDLLPVWERMKHRIRATPRMTRTEAFLQWVHDNPADVYRITDEAIEADVSRLVEEEARMAAEYKDPKRYEELSDEEFRDVYEEAFPRSRVLAKWEQAVPF